MQKSAPLITPVLIAGCTILMISFAIRASFGVFQIPIAEEFNWPRAEFSLAIAIQNLAWGIGQPLFGALAEKMGDRRAIIIGALVYAAGLQAGLSPMDIMPDEPITIDVPGSGPWSPQNYTREFLGPITLTEALAKSINTVAVRVSEYAGRKRIKAIAQDFGITSKLANGPSIALGVSEVTLLELTGAYAGILNGGRRSAPYGLVELRLKGDRSVLMGSDRQDPIRVMDERAAGDLVYMLNQVVNYGSGARARLADRPAAGKTGTTQAARDAWFIGFTADYVAGIWMGYDDNTPLTGVTGGGLPAEIWHETMTRVHEGLPPRPLPLIVPPIAQGEDRLAQSIFESVVMSIMGRTD